MIQSHIGSTQGCGVVLKLKGSPTYQADLLGWALLLGLRPYRILKLEGFSHLSDRSFGLDSPVGLRYLSLVLSLRVYA